jgi:hypothetical protein
MSLLWECNWEGKDILISEVFVLDFSSKKDTQRCLSALIVQYMFYTNMQYVYA